ncbi:MAG: acyl-CoA dehydrogenase family protein [Nevskia sp.]|nr:acyl-CoA dehydrogenase family protein [Nevskia sp.]
MSETLHQLRESARHVLAELGLAAAEPSTWDLVTELGWLLVAVPEELGGLGQGLSGACAFHTELGRGLASVPYASATLAIDAVCRIGAGRRADWVQRLTAGEYVCTPLSDSTQIARVAAGKLTLRGVASAVPSADKASHILVCSSAADCVALVPLDRAGVQLTYRPTWDSTRRLFDVHFTDVALDEPLMLARETDAQALCRALSIQRDLALAADSVGGAGALLERTVDYLQTRRQFARPLALFQALKHRCADLKTQLAAAEALLIGSLDRIGDSLDAPGAEAAAKAAKYLACSMYASLAEEALQLHGGIGMTVEHPCHLFLKRALLNQQLGRRPDCYEPDLADALLGGL